MYALTPGSRALAYRHSGNALSEKLRCNNALQCAATCARWRCVSVRLIAKRLKKRHLRKNHTRERRDKRLTGCLSRDSRTDLAPRYANPTLLVHCCESSAELVINVHLVGAQSATGIRCERFKHCSTDRSRYAQLQHRTNPQRYDKEPSSAHL